MISCHSVCSSNYQNWTCQQHSTLLARWSAPSSLASTAAVPTLAWRQHSTRRAWASQDSVWPASVVASRRDASRHVLRAWDATKTATRAHDSDWAANCSWTALDSRARVTSTSCWSCWQYRPARRPLLRLPTPASLCAPLTATWARCWPTRRPIRPTWSTIVFVVSERANGHVRARANVDDAVFAAENAVLPVYRQTIDLWNNDLLNFGRKKKNENKQTFRRCCTRRQCWRRRRRSCRITCITAWRHNRSPIRE